MLFWVLMGSFESAAWGSACCARSSAAPSMILGEDRAQFGFGATLASVVAKADEDGAARLSDPGSSEFLQTYRIDGAVLLSDRFQMGLSLSMVQHQVTQQNSSVTGGAGEIFSDSSVGWGDTRLSLAYEWLPSWTYSKWRPQAFGFFVVTLPTGKSVYEAQSLLASDVVGNGFYSVSLGSIFLKKWANWDVFLMPEVHYSLPGTFQVASKEVQVFPGYGGSIGVGGGFSLASSPLRLGLRVQPRIDQAKVTPWLDSLSMAGGVANCDVAFDVSYLFGVSDSAMLFYSDQTLLGPAMNSNLSRMIGLNLQHKWER